MMYQLLAPAMLTTLIPISIRRSIDLLVEVVNRPESMTVEALYRRPSCCGNGWWSSRNLGRNGRIRGLHQSGRSPFGTVGESCAISAWLFEHCVIANDVLPPALAPTLSLRQAA
jgi:hypothetical protein